jgi:Mg2+ and Co2+ transporter CorA
MNLDETIAKLEKRVEALEKDLPEMRRSELSLEQITAARRDVIREEPRSTWLH